MTPWRAICSSAQSLAFCAGSSPEEGFCRLKQTSDQPDACRRRGPFRDIGALNAPLEWRRAKLRRGFWSTMSRLQIQGATTAPRAVCGLVLATAQLGSTAAEAVSRLQFLSIPNTAAARGPVDRLRPSTEPRGRRERVL